MTTASLSAAIWLVEDDTTLREATLQTLELAGLSVAAFETADTALAAARHHLPSVLVTDVRMPGMDGLTLFNHVLALDAELPVILITGHGDISMAVQAVQRGAFDFIVKPFSTEQLIASLRRALQSRALVLDNRQLRELLQAAHAPLVGESSAILGLRSQLPGVARSDLDLVITGESGSGKELLGRLLHQESSRASGPFVVMNCAAFAGELAERELFGSGLPPAHGVLASANQGTLFLKEIDRLPGSLQARLLLALETKEWRSPGSTATTPLNLRIMASTGANLQAAVANGHFRADLFYRINAAHLHLPPLRERRGDIPLLFAAFLREALRQTGRARADLSLADRKRLLEHDWPGNARELRTYAYSLALGVQRESPAAAAVVRQPALAARVDQFEQMLLREALEAAQGNVVLAAKRLQTPRKTLYEKFARHGIDPAAFRRRARAP